MADQPVADPQTPVEPPQPALAKSSRLLSLDAFRGITIAGMIMVNNPGDWGKIYAPLGHATWNGWTPTDLVFPSFLFIVGVAMTYSFDRRLSEGASRLRLFEHVVRRTIILFLLGLILFSFPIWRLMAPYILALGGLFCLFRHEPPLAWPLDRAARRWKIAACSLIGLALLWFVVDFGYFQSPHPPAVKTGALRVPGVLQRIALCYFFASVVMMFLGVRGRVLATIVVVVGYWWLVKHPWSVVPPDAYPASTRPEGSLHAWLDARLLGGHVHSELPDPEGILGTIGGVGTCLLGVLTGGWLRGRRDDRDKLIGLFFAANLLIVAGLWMGHSVPINKKIWTSSYVLLAGGIAMHMLAMCHWLIEVKGWRRWSWPFLVFGTNAILVFFASGILGRILGFFSFGLDAPSMKAWIYQHWFAAHFPATGSGPYTASLAFALAYGALWLVLMIPLYRKRLFLKV
ncbi:MAG TPA: DUF5009 domain-containing protein [Phycisphaerae bacterium]|nr:DUF5009 domain-containing protein [Phycisphaerae bacterium]HRY68670.1 DUF5009 domain-containing protein [Phycisphaerae bacterium]HSA25496.1 DUF5009 domain-containing protein [Phycisphaerae bacterium]